MRYVCLLLGPCPNENEGLCDTLEVDCEFAIEATECANLAIEAMKNANRNAGKDKVYEKSKKGKDR